MHVKCLLSLIKTTIAQQIRKLVVALLLTSVSANATAEISKHQQIMAGFLLHLTSFTQWQDLGNGNIELCLLGQDQFKTYINKMLKRRPKNNKGQVIVLSYIDDADEINLTQCQLIYLQPKHYQKLWQAISPMQNVLLVSQSKTFLAQGGMINFVLQDKRVKLEVNLPAVKAAGLKISSELLKHAKIINGKPHKKYSLEDDTDAQN